MPKNLKNEILLVGKGINEKISNAKTLKSIEEIKISAFGKKGEITNYLKN